jgi:hypothetical protein
MVRPRSHMQRNRFGRYFRAVPYSVLLVSSLDGCNKQAFESQVRDQRQDSIPGLGVSVVRVSASQSSTGTKGALVANAMYTQVIEAGGNTTISGTSIAFPPGSLAIDTEVSIAATTAIGNSDTLARLDLGTEVARAGAPVAIQSSTPADAVSPFTLAIPLPDGSGLTLTGDPLSNLSIIYFVKKVSQGSAGFTGVIPRSLIDVSSGYAKFSTTFFGTYQAIITTQPIEKPIEKPVEPVIDPKPVPKPVASSLGVFAAGFMTTSFEPALSGQRQEGLQGILTPYSPFMVGSTRRLTASYLSLDTISE